MQTLLIVGSCITALAITVVVWSRMKIRKYNSWLIRSAETAEAEGKFETAIYFYGEALANYHMQDRCREKIRTLWNAHGPFNFKKLREEFTNRTDIDRDGDLHLFEDHIRMAREVAAGNIERREWEA